MSNPPVATDKSIDERKKALRDAIDRMVEAGAAGAQFRVTEGNVQFVVRGGVAELGKSDPVPLDGRFRIACITKTFVATVVLQLVGEGKIVLDDPVEKYLPGLLPDGGKITVRMLLQHTSGLFNHNDGFQRPSERFLRDRYKHYEAEELVTVSTSRPLNFEPGTEWSYSNTNYIVLGMLIGRITGNSCVSEVTRRIIEPLGLHDTVFPGDDPNIPEPHAHGYMVIDGKSVDATLMNPSEAASAGEMISTTADLDRFLVGLMDGTLLGSAEFTEMTTALAPEKVKNMPMSAGYGLGFMPMETSCGVRLWGHGGGIPGYATFAAATLDGSQRIEASITLNIDPSDFSGSFEGTVRAAINAAAGCG
jgi:D-alanyl-D-alanine carboxypeptidase